MANDMKNAGAATLFAAGIQTGGFGARLFGYAMFYIALSFVYWTLLMLTKIHISGYILSFLLMFIPVAIPFILWERNIRKFRRKHGLSIYKNVREELEQIEFNKMYEKEKEMEERAKAVYEARKK